MASIALTLAGAAFHHYSETVLSPKAAKITKAPKPNQPAIDTDKLDTYILVIRMVKKLLKYSKKTIQQVKYMVNSGVISIPFREWIRSPKFMETMVLLLGSIVMAHSNFKSFKGKPTLYSKVTTIGGSLLTESKGILTMYQLMMGISSLARTRNPPFKQLSIAGAMILTSHIARKYSE